METPKCHNKKTGAELVRTNGQAMVVCRCYECGKVFDYELWRLKNNE
ncbi:hypothetical protein LCGC14_1790300 [marine sediment metagenome]|uniref:Uncharacterized protein n=1 Tax=marine sediment metagenome TaxID=412755 RepID=A0A0F9J7M1_9ZZZZ